MSQIMQKLNPQTPNNSSRSMNSSQLTRPQSSRSGSNMLIYVQQYSKNKQQEQVERKKQENQDQNEKQMKGKQKQGSVSSLNQIGWNKIQMQNNSVLDQDLELIESNRRKVLRQRRMFGKLKNENSIYQFQKFQSQGNLMVNIDFGEKMEETDHGKLKDPKKFQDDFEDELIPEKFNQIQYNRYKKQLEKEFFDEKGNFIYSKKAEKYKQYLQSKQGNLNIETNIVGKYKEKENEILNERQKVFNEEEIIQLEKQKTKYQNFYDSQKAQNISQLNYSTTDPARKLQNKSFLEIKQKHFQSVVENIIGNNKINIAKEFEKQINAVSVEMENELFNIQQKLSGADKKIYKLEQEKDKYKEQLKAESEKREFFEKELKILDEKYNELISKHTMIAQFLPEYQKIVKSGYTAQSIQDELYKIQQFSIQQATKISELDNQIRLLNQEIIEKQIHQEKKFNNLLDKDNQRTYETVLFMNQLKEQADEYLDANSYKQKYLILAKHVNDLYVKCSDKTSVYPLYPKDDGPTVDVSDPHQTLKMIEKIINISSNEKIQNYLRQIIVSANQLQRKYLPENINNKFEPEIIYKLIQDNLVKQENQIVQLKVQNKELSTKLEICMRQKSNKN